MDTPIRKPSVCIDCGRNPGTKIGQNGYDYCDQCWEAQPSKTCSKGACPACCGCGDCVTWLAGEPPETRWNCTCKSSDGDPAGDLEFEKDIMSDNPTALEAPPVDEQGNVIDSRPFRERDGSTMPNWESRPCSACGTPFFPDKSGYGKFCSPKCFQRRSGMHGPTAGESVINALADTLEEGYVSESKLSKINECFDFDVKEKKTAKGAHGGGNEYKQIELSHEFSDLATRALKYKNKPKKQSEPESDPGEGETGEKPNAQKTPSGFKKTEVGLPKEKDKPGKVTKSPHEAFDRSLDTILEVYGGFEDGCPRCTGDENASLCMKCISDDYEHEMMQSEKQEDVCPKCGCPVASHRLDGFDEYGCQEVIDVDQEVGKLPKAYKCRCRERFDSDSVRQDAESCYSCGSTTNLGPDGTGSLICTRCDEAAGDDRPIGPNEDVVKEGVSVRKCSACGRPAKWYWVDKGPTGQLQQIDYCGECMLRFDMSDVVMPIKESADLPGYGSQRDMSSLEERMCVGCQMPFMVDLNGPRPDRTMCDECAEAIRDEIRMARYQERRL